MGDASVRYAERVFKSTHRRAYCRPIHESHLLPGRKGPGETRYGGTGCVRAPTTAVCGGLLHDRVRRRTSYAFVCYIRTPHLVQLQFATNIGSKHNILFGYDAVTVEKKKRKKDISN